MSKIICEICGTTYSDTESRCPICGWSHNPSGNSAENPGLEQDDLDLSEFENILNSRPGESAPEQDKPRKNREIFDFDAVNGQDPAPGAKKKREQNIPEDDDEEEEEEERSSPALVALLTILIVLLVGATLYVLLRYFLPNFRNDTETLPSTAVTTEAIQTEAPTIPCTGLSLVSGMAELNQEGQNWLLHVVVTPEDTTDGLVYTSMDPAIATVTEEGRLTAVSEGETTVVITCGDERIECPVTVKYLDLSQETESTTAPAEETAAPAEETAAPTEDAPEATQETVPDEETAPEEEPTESTQTTESTAETKPVDPNVVLKLKKTDITFSKKGVYITLELDCDLSVEDVQWSVRNSNVATVKDGKVTAVGPGLTVVTAKYGDQTVECVVRCNF